MSISKLGFYWKYFGTFLLIWVASFFVAEGAFRLIGDKPSADMGGLYMQFGAGFRQRPRVDTGADWSTGYFSAHTDDLGLRCDAERRMGTKPGDAIDVLFLGDSQGFGNGVNFEDTIAGTAAILANEHGVKVRNACIGGQHPPNQLQLAKWLRDSQKIKVSTYVYLFTPPGLASCESMTTGQVGSDGRVYGKTIDKLLLARTWLKTHSVLHSRLRDALRSHGIGVNPDVETPFVYRIYAAGEAERTNEASCAAFLKRFKEFAAEDGATIKLVYVPGTVEMSFDAVQRSAGKLGLAVDADAPFRVLTAAAMETDLPVHDLRPVLRAFSARGEQLSLYPDFHYTAPLSKASGFSVWSYLTSESLPSHPDKLLTSE